MKKMFKKLMAISLIRTLTMAMTAGCKTTQVKLMKLRQIQWQKILQKLLQLMLLGKPQKHLRELTHFIHPDSLIM